MEQDLAELGLSEAELHEAITRTQQLLAEAYGQILTRETEGREPRLPVPPHPKKAPAGTTVAADGSRAAAPAKTPAPHVASPTIPRSFLDAPSSAVTSRPEEAPAAPHIDHHVDGERIAAHEDNASATTEPPPHSRPPSVYPEDGCVGLAEGQTWRSPEVVRVTRPHPHRSGSTGYEFANGSIRVDGRTLPARGWQPHGQDFVHLGAGAYFHSDTEWIEHLTDDQVLTHLAQIIRNAQHHTLIAHHDILHFTPTPSDTTGSENTGEKHLADKYLIEAHQIMWERNVEQLPVPGGTTQADPHLLRSVRDAIALTLSQSPRHKAEELATKARIEHNIAAPRATAPGGAPRQHTYAASQSTHGADPVAGLAQGVSAMDIRQPMPQPPAIYNDFAGYGVRLNTDVSLRELASLRSNPDLSWPQQQAISHLYNRALNDGRQRLREREFYGNPEYQNLTKYTDSTDGLDFLYDPADPLFVSKVEAAISGARRVYRAGFRTDQHVTFTLPPHDQITEINRIGNSLSVRTVDPGTAIAGVFDSQPSSHIILTNTLIARQQDPALEGQFVSNRRAEATQLSTISDAFQSASEIVVVHELGHFYDYSYNFITSHLPLTESQLPHAATVSTYATTNHAEFIAETFTNIVLGGKILPGAKETYRLLRGPLPTAAVEPVEAPLSSELLPRLQDLVSTRVPDSTTEEIESIHQQFSAVQRLLILESQADMIRDRIAVNRNLEASGQPISNEKEFSQARPHVLLLEPSIEDITIFITTRRLVNSYLHNARRPAISESDFADHLHDSRTWQRHLSQRAWYIFELITVRNPLIARTPEFLPEATPSEIEDSYDRIPSESNSLPLDDLAHSVASDILRSRIRATPPPDGGVFSENEIDDSVRYAAKAWGAVFPTSRSAATLLQSRRLVNQRLIRQGHPAASVREYSAALYDSTTPTRSRGPERVFELIHLNRRPRPLHVPPRWLPGLPGAGRKPEPVVNRTGGRAVGSGSQEPSATVTSGTSANSTPAPAEQADPMEEREFLTTWARSHNWSLDWARSLYAEASGLVLSAVGPRPVVGTRPAPTEVRRRLHRVIAEVALARDGLQPGGKDGKRAETAARTRQDHARQTAHDNQLTERLRAVFHAMTARDQATDRPAPHTSPTHPQHAAGIPGTVDAAVDAAREILPGLRPDDLAFLYDHHYRPRTETATPAEPAPTRPQDVQQPTASGELAGLAEAREILAGLDEEKRNSLLSEAAQIMANRHQAPPVLRDGQTPEAPGAARFTLNDDTAALIAERLHREPRPDLPSMERPASLLSERLREEFGTRATTGGAAGGRPGVPGAAGAVSAGAGPDAVGMADDGEWVRAWASSRNWTVEFANTQFARAFALVADVFPYRSRPAGNGVDVGYRERFRRLVASVAVARAGVQSTSKGKEGEHGPSALFDEQLVSALRGVVAALDADAGPVSATGARPESGGGQVVAGTGRTVGDALRELAALVPDTPDQELLELLQAVRGSAPAAHDTPPPSPVTGAAQDDTDSESVPGEADAMIRTLALEDLPRHLAIWAHTAYSTLRPMPLSVDAAAIDALHQQRADHIRDIVTTAQRTAHTQATTPSRQDIHRETAHLIARTADQPRIPGQSGARTTLTPRDRHDLRTETVRHLRTLYGDTPPTTAIRTGPDIRTWDDLVTEDTTLRHWTTLSDTERHLPLTGQAWLLAPHYLTHPTPPRMHGGGTRGVRVTENELHTAFEQYFAKPGNRNTIPKRDAKETVSADRAAGVTEVNLITHIILLRKGEKHLSQRTVDLLRANQWVLEENGTNASGETLWLLESYNEWSDRRYAAAFDAFYRKNPGEQPSIIYPRVWGLDLGKYLANARDRASDLSDTLRRVLQQNKVEVLAHPTGKDKWTIKYKSSGAKLLAVTEDPPAWWPGPEQRGPSPVAESASVWPTDSSVGAGGFGDDAAYSYVSGIGRISALGPAGSSGAGRAAIHVERSAEIAAWFQQERNRGKIPKALERQHSSKSGKILKSFVAYWEDLLGKGRYADSQNAPEIREAEAGGLRLTIEASPVEEKPDRVHYTLAGDTERAHVDSSVAQNILDVHGLRLTSAEDWDEETPRTRMLLAELAIWFRKHPGRAPATPRIVNEPVELQKFYYWWANLASAGMMDSVKNAHIKWSLEDEKIPLLNTHNIIRLDRAKVQRERMDEETKAAIIALHRGGAGGGPGVGEAGSSGVREHRTLTAGAGGGEGPVSADGVPGTRLSAGADDAFDDAFNGVLNGEFDRVFNGEYGVFDGVLEAPGSVAGASGGGWGGEGGFTQGEDGSTPVGGGLIDDMSVDDVSVDDMIEDMDGDGPWPGVVPAVVADGPVGPVGAEDPYAGVWPDPAAWEVPATGEVPAGMRNDAVLEAAIPELAAIGAARDEAARVERARTYLEDKPDLVAAGLTPDTLVRLRQQTDHLFEQEREQAYQQLLQEATRTGAIAQQMRQGHSADQIVRTLRRQAEQPLRLWPVTDTEADDLWSDAALTFRLGQEISVPDLANDLRNRRTAPPATPAPTVPQDNAAHPAPPEPETLTAHHLHAEVFQRAETFLSQREDLRTAQWTTPYLVKLWEQTNSYYLQALEQHFLGHLPDPYDPLNWQTIQEQGLWQVDENEAVLLWTIAATHATHGTQPTPHHLATTLRTHRTNPTPGPTPTNPPTTILRAQTQNHHTNTLNQQLLHQKLSQLPENDPARNRITKVLKTHPPTTTPAHHPLPPSFLDAPRPTPQPHPTRKPNPAPNPPTPPDPTPTEIATKTHPLPWQHTPALQQLLNPPDTTPANDTTPDPATLEELVRRHRTELTHHLAESITTRLDQAGTHNPTQDIYLDITTFPGNNTDMWLSHVLPQLPTLLNRSIFIPLAPDRDLHLCPPA
ncbi:hypothetical protein [Streptomyces anthocyanicus]|uniref:hypothetical protein n=1 Tax=Streptomyces anthocyanicus TaxID=68174 RepID=UPI003254DFDD